MKILLMRKMMTNTATRMIKVMRKMTRRMMRALPVNQDEKIEKGPLENQRLQPHRLKDPVQAHPHQRARLQMPIWPIFLEEMFDVQTALPLPHHCGGEILKGNHYATLAVFS
jgi:hypothetical protein